MTTSDPIPERLALFLDRNVESIEQLEILRILGETSDQEWRSSDLARDAQIRPADISSQLAALEQRRLLKTEQRGNELFCRYGPATPEISEQLADLLRFYKERPVTLIRMVYNRVNDRLKAFADSFRLRKEN